MKYFKHMADMLEDPWVQDVFMAEHGIAGYGFICGIYEIYAKLCKDKPGSEIDIPLKNIARKLHVSSAKVKSWLTQCSSMGKLSVRFENILVEIVKLSIPKMVDLIDEWTSKLRRKSGENPPSYIEEEVKEEAKENPLPPKGEPVDKPPGGERNKNEYDPEFERFWKAYPKTNGAKPDAAKAWREVQKPGRTEKFPGLDPVLKSLEAWKQSAQWNRDEGSYIKHPGPWLRSALWTVTPSPEQPLKPYANKPPPEPSKLIVDEIAEKISCQWLHYNHMPDHLIPRAQFTFDQVKSLWKLNGEYINLRDFEGAKDVTDNRPVTDQPVQPF